MHQNKLVLVVDDDVGDRIFAQLEDRGVDERVRQEVVPAVLEQPLHRRRQVRVRDVEEWTWVVDPLGLETAGDAPPRHRAHSKG